jgi:sugar lactone lactonase YvrE
LAAILLSSAALRAQGILTLTPGATASTLAGTGTAGYSGDTAAATSATLFNPAGAVYDGSGNLYISDAQNNVVRKIAVGGTITTVVGSGTQGYSGDGGAATAAALDQPMGLALDPSGNLYIADSHNHVIREVSGGTITTIAGTGTAGFSGDGGPATAATLTLPQGVAVDASGNVYIADTGNHRIRKLTGTQIATIAGTGNEAYLGDGGAATAASLDMPTGLALDANGNLYIADSHNHTLREIAGTTISTLAGSGTPGFSGDGGAATAAALALPLSVALDSAGNIYVADTSNNRIRELANGIITTIAGSGVEDFSGDSGIATAAAMDMPRSVAADATGDLVVADRLNQRIRLIAVPSVSFGSESVGGASASQTIVLGNSGTASLVVSSLSLPTGFRVSGGTCSAVPITISASASCSVALVFSPTAAGTSSGTITASGTGIVPQRLLVSGTGTQQTPTVTVSPVNAPYGSTSVTLTASVAFTGTTLPTGKFTFQVDSSTVASVYCTAAGSGTGSPLTCTASVSASSLSPANHTISGSIAADSNFTSASGTATLTIANIPYVFIAGSGDVASLNASGSVSSTAIAGGGRGAAVDANGYVWSINSNGTSLSTFTPTGVLGTSYSPTGLTAVSAIAIDGNSNVIITNGNGVLSVVSNAGVALSTTAGSTSAAPSGVAVDNSGNIWVANPTANTVDEIIGGASATAPLANAVKSSTIGTKP